MSSRPDVVVIGVGPGGMATAVTLASEGVDVQVVDEQRSPGGQVYRGIEDAYARRAEDADILGEQYASGIDLVRQFRESGAAFWPSTSVWEVSGGSGGTSLAVRMLRNGRSVTLTPKHVVLATGAMERPTPFPGWTLPGVMGVGAAQTLLKGAALVPSGRVVLAGSGPLLYLFAWQLLQAGIVPARLLDTTPAVSLNALRALPAAALHGAPELLRGAKWLAAIRRAGIVTETRVLKLRAIGQDRLEAVEYGCGSRTRTLDADLLLVHDGVVPSTWLAMSMACEHVWDATHQCWVPRLDGSGASSREGVSIVGDAGGIGGSDVAKIRGRIAGLHLARGLGKMDGPLAAKQIARGHHELRGLLSLRRFLDFRYPPSPMFQSPQGDDTIVCRCEEVTVADLKAVAALGVTGPNQGKAFTRCGMGPCMGRECAATVSQLIAGYHGLRIEDVGCYRIRPPVRPITVGQLADVEIDDDTDRSASGADVFAALSGRVR